MPSLFQFDIPGWHACKTATVVYREPSRIHYVAVVISFFLTLICGLLIGCQENPSPASTHRATNTTLPTQSAMEDAVQCKKLEKSPPTNGTEVITFEDINLRMQADVAYRPFMLTDRARELDGRTVRLKGYMDEGVMQSRGIKDFILLKNRECKFGPGGQADHLVQIFLKDGVTTAFTKELIIVEGVFEIKPYQGPDGFTWSVYNLAAVSVTKRR